MATKKIVESVKLDKVLGALNSQPKLTLRGVKRLNLSYAFRNDHFGARHFAKEFVPRLTFSNPGVDIRIEKMRKSPSDKWKPEIEVVYEDDTKAVISMHDKWSTAIAKELMDTAGADAWRRYKQNTLSNGQPIFEGEENESRVRRSDVPEADLPSLNEFKASPEGKVAIELARRAAKEDSKKSRMTYHSYLRSKNALTRNVGAIKERQKA